MRIADCKKINPGTQVLDLGGDAETELKANKTELKAAAKVNLAAADRKKISEAEKRS